MSESSPSIEETLKKNFEQLRLGIRVLNKGGNLACLKLVVDGPSATCEFSYLAPDANTPRTLKLLYPIDRYGNNEASLFDRLAGTVLVGFSLIPLDHTSMRSKIEDFMVAGKQTEMFI